MRGGSVTKDLAVFMNCVRAVLRKEPLYMDGRCDFMRKQILARERREREALGLPKSRARRVYRQHFDTYGETK